MDLQTIIADTVEMVLAVESDRWGLMRSTNGIASECLLAL